MKSNLLILSLIIVCLNAFGQKKVPEATELYVDVPKITPGTNGSPPSDAIILFNGKDLNSWKKQGSEEPAGWAIKGGALEVVPSSGSIETKRSFGDVQLHIEWMSPYMEGETGQGYANSGVFLMGKYEVQVLNSYDNKTYSNGQAASIYKQHVPLVNATKPVNEWQSYDIIFTAPKFSDKGTFISPARVTVIHNGVLVQNNIAFWGPTEYIGSPLYKVHPEKLPLALQDHTDPVQFRNIWVREL